LSSLNLNSLLRMARLFPPQERTHYSIVLHKNKIVAVGTENRGKTHPKAKALGYKYPTIHSELAAYIELEQDPAKCILVNLRVSPTGKIGMARPCRYCLGWVTEMFGSVWYTDQHGLFQKLGDE